MNGKINETGAIYSNIYGALVDCVMLNQYLSEYSGFSAIMELLLVAGPVNAWRRWRKIKQGVWRERENDKCARD